MEMMVNPMPAPKSKAMVVSVGVKTIDATKASSITHVGDDGLVGQQFVFLSPKTRCP